MDQSRHAVCKSTDLPDKPMKRLVIDSVDVLVGRRHGNLVLFPADEENGTVYVNLKKNNWPKKSEVN